MFILSRNELVFAQFVYFVLIGSSRIADCRRWHGMLGRLACSCSLRKSSRKRRSAPRGQMLLCSIVWTIVVHCTFQTFQPFGNQLEYMSLVSNRSSTFPKAWRMASGNSQNMRWDAVAGVSAKNSISQSLFRTVCRSTATAGATFVGTEALMFLVW